jgi:uncharacterized protein (DUF924 family)
MRQAWDDVLDFWFRELKPAQWFEASDALDQRIRDRFGDLLDSARRGALDAWSQDPHGRLALIIVLDQFSRNIYRDSPEAFASDSKAQALVLAGLDAGHDRGLTFAERQFFYMPLMHAEDVGMQDLCVKKFEELVAFAENALGFARSHRKAVARFGRFPHRNAVLERESTAEETAFLQSGKSVFEPEEDEG